MKAAENAIFAACDQERLSDEVEGKIVAGVRGLVDMTDDLPGSREELGLFRLKSFRTKIERCRQRGSASDVAIGMYLKVRHGRSRASF
jgi:hypothetical protein